MVQRQVQDVLKGRRTQDPVVYPRCATRLRSSEVRHRLLQHGADQQSNGDHVEDDRQAAPHDVLHAGPAEVEGASSTSIPGWLGHGRVGEGLGRGCASVEVIGGVERCEVDGVCSRHGGFV